MGSLQVGHSIVHSDLNLSRDFLSVWIEEGLEATHHRTKDDGHDNHCKHEPPEPNLSDEAKNHEGS